MSNQFSFFEYYLDPDLDTFSDADLETIRREYKRREAAGCDPSHCSDVTIKTPRYEKTVKLGEVIDKIKGYEYKIKGMYWEFIQSGRDIPPDSCLLDLIPGIHWIHQTWSPKYEESRFRISSTPNSYVIPEIIRPYVDFVNSVKELSPVIRDNFVGKVNFQILSDLEKPLYCHLNYGTDGKITLVEETHPNPTLTLKGYYVLLYRLFHLGDLRPKRSSDTFSYLHWKMKKYFEPRRRNEPFIHPFLYNFLPTPNLNVYDPLKQWFYTLLKVEQTYATKFDLFYGRPVKRYRVSLDDNHRLRIQIQYRDVETPQNYYPQSFYESISIFEFLRWNLYGQILDIYR
ncbi:MAG: hypothetical protein ACFFFG_15170 [Candidatus Thorarchaeota archaeon]